MRVIFKDSGGQVRVRQAAGMKKNMSMSCPYNISCGSSAYAIIPQLLSEVLFNGTEAVISKDKAIAMGLPDVTDANNNRNGYYSNYSCLEFKFIVYNSAANLIFFSSRTFAEGSSYPYPINIGEAQMILQTNASGQLQFVTPVGTITNKTIQVNTMYRVRLATYNYWVGNSNRSVIALTSSTSDNLPLVEDNRLDYNLTESLNAKMYMSQYWNMIFGRKYAANGAVTNSSQVIYMVDLVSFEGTCYAGTNGILQRKDFITPTHQYNSLYDLSDNISNLDGYSNGNTNAGATTITRDRIIVPKMIYLKGPQGQTLKYGNGQDTAFYFSYVPGNQPDPVGVQQPAAVNAGGNQMSVVGNYGMNVTLDRNEIEWTMTGGTTWQGYRTPNNNLTEYINSRSGVTSSRLCWSYPQTVPNTTGVPRGCYFNNNSFNSDGGEMRKSLLLYFDFVMSPSLTQSGTTYPNLFELYNGSIEGLGLFWVNNPTSSNLHLMAKGSTLDNAVVCTLNNSEVGNSNWGVRNKLMIYADISGNIVVAVNGKITYQGFDSTPANKAVFNALYVFGNYGNNNAPWELDIGHDISYSKRSTIDLIEFRIYGSGSHSACKDGVIGVGRAKEIMNNVLGAV